MDYQRIYDSLIQRSKERVPPAVHEKHHIIPRCLGGSDESENISLLTPEEHYLAHQLLTKVHPGHKGLAKAAHMMCTGRPSNKYYGWVRRRFIQAQSESMQGENNPAYGTRIIFNPHLRENKRIGKNDPLPEGWQEGAVYDFDSYFHKLSKKEEKERDKLAKKEAKMEELRVLHEIYVKEGFEGVLKTGYTKSKQNLVMRFAQYLPEFVPQNGKKRGLL